MGLSVPDRKILWTKAANRCSYNHEGEVCNEELAILDSEEHTLVGEECHIIGEKPSAARYIDDFPERDAYANLILLCRKHHKIVDDDENKYTIDVLRSMKKSHEQSMARRAKRGEIQPIIIKDSVFKTKAEQADEAIAMEVNRPAELSNVQVELDARGVKRAIGFSTNQGLSSIVMTCSSCGSLFPFVCTGPPPPSIPCPHCGERNVLH